MTQLNKHESTSPNIKYFSIEFDREGINKFPEYMESLVSPTPTDQDIITYQLKALKQHIYYINKKLAYEYKSRNI